MNARTRGAFIVFEGVDGSGKSTQVARLVARLEAGGLAVVVTREPHDCPAGRRIREMARSGEPVTAEQELAWFWEQRREHVRDVIAPALAAGRVVVCDRYYLSSVAYQGSRGLDPEKILRESEAEFPRPDLVLWLDVDVGAGLSRTQARGDPAEPVFEDRSRLEAVADIYRSLSLGELVRIDAAGDEDEVAAAIGQCVSERLGLVV
ncbi:MAG: dTMP kinase [Deltaproteobacteria bacterium]|nr:dTMP kinase [Deltaproteobacteria bacterium]